MLTYCRSLLVAQSISMNKAIGRDVTDKLSAAFATTTADATGKDERTIAAPPRGARALGAAAETSFDKGVSWRDEKLVLRLDPITLAPTTTKIQKKYPIKTYSTGVTPRLLRRN